MLTILYAFILTTFYIGRVVREKLQRLQMGPQMSLRVKASCVCHGLLFIRDKLKMCSVG